MIKKEFGKCLEHIEQTWDQLTCKVTRNSGLHFALPNPFISPSEGCFNNDQFYWDSYFIILGLVNQDKTALAKGMVENLFFCFDKYKIIPMRNRLFSLGISDPPFLTSMIDEVYTKTGSKTWLKKAVTIAEDELKQYWMNKDINENHLIYEGLSRYCDHYLVNETAEHESGWDMTSRFDQECLNFLPVDLNSNLYKYEKDLEKFHKILGNIEASKYYHKQAKKRKISIDNLLWNEKKGFYLDFNYKTKSRSNFFCLAGFYPLWAGVASPEQAEQVRKNLEIFEFAGGLANTQREGISLNPKKQWDYPNGWANQQYIVIKGLLNYGFISDAKRISLKWLNMNKDLFEKTGKMWERYDVTNRGLPESERYPLQTGFGWTNGVFVRLVNELSTLEDKEESEFFKDALKYSRNRKRDKIKKIAKKIINA